LSELANSPCGKWRLFTEVKDNKEKKKNLLFDVANKLVRTLDDISLSPILRRYDNPAPGGKNAKADDDDDDLMEVDAGGDDDLAAVGTLFSQEEVDKVLEVAERDAKLEFDAKEVVNVRGKLEAKKVFKLFDGKNSYLRVADCTDFAVMSDIYRSAGS
jgi:hypothetical protein